MKINKPVIKVKEGRAYLHTEGLLRSGVKWIMVSPLGSSPRDITTFAKDFKAEVKFIGG